MTRDNFEYFLSNGRDAGQFWERIGIMVVGMWIAVDFDVNSLLNSR